MRKGKMSLSGEEGTENTVSPPSPQETKSENGDENGVEKDTESSGSPRPTSTTRMPTLSARATLTRTPVAMLESSEVLQAESDPEPDQESEQEPVEKGVLITEVRDERDLGKELTPVVEEEEEEEKEETEEGVEEEELFLEEEPEEETEVFNHITIETVDAEPKDEDYDTDLEDKFDEDEEDPVTCQYKKVCDQLGLIPISYFIRHMHETDLTMRYHGLGPSEAKAIALVLKDNIHLEKFNVSGNWIGTEGGQAMCRMLEENDYITEMGLSESKLGNAGAEHICKMLGINAGLRKLDLSGNEFDDKVAHLFADAIENNKYLRDVNLSRNKFGEVAGEILGPAIGSNDILDALDLSWNHFRQKGAVAVAKGIKENVRLKTCCLAWNGFGPEGGAAIADAMGAHESLLELDISGNRLTLDTATKMAKALTTNETLKILRMGNNLLTSAGAIALATAINNSDTCEIQELDLTDVPVEYEFLRIVEDIKLKKPDFRVTHGPIMRAGNTLEDLGKLGIDPFKNNKDPVVILKEHIVVNDFRLVDILKRYDTEGALSVTPQDFLAALDELAVPYNKPKLEEAVHRIARDQSGKIYFGDFADVKKG